MTRNLSAFAAALILSVCPAIAGEAEQMTLEQILDHHYEAIGGLDAWSSVSTAKFVGTLSAPNGFEAPFTMMFKTPDKSRLEFTFQGMTGVQAVDGNLAWQIMPFMGKTEPEPMPEEQARLMIEQTDFDGPLVNWQEDGHKVEYEGIDDIEGTETHKLKVTLANGDVRYYFLDSDAFLPIMVTAKVTLQGQKVDMQTTYSDYKEVGGLMLAHSFEQQQVGAPQGQSQVFTVDSAELNVEMADDQFSMPSASE